MGSDSAYVISSTSESKSKTRRRKAGYAELRPEALVFGFLPKGGNATLQVSIVNNRAKPISWKADTGEASWLMIEGMSSGQVQPYSQQVIDVKTDTSVLNAEGTYLTTLNFILLDSVNIHIPASVEFLGPRQVAENHIPPKSPTVTPGNQPTSTSTSTGQPSLSITVASGSSGSMNATVSNPKENKGKVTWNATSSESWLTLSPSFSGTLQPYQQPGYSQTIEVIVDATSLAPGKYRPTLSFAATDIANFKSAPETEVTVQVTVN